MWSMINFFVCFHVDSSCGIARFDKVIISNHVRCVFGILGILDILLLSNM